MSSLAKNVSSQVLTFGLTNVTTGAPITTTPTFTTAAWVTGDGTQALFAGTFTYLGNGQSKYVPTQGETNVTSFGMFIAVSNAVPINIHLFTDNWDTSKSLLTVGTGTSQISVSGGVVSANAVKWANFNIPAVIGVSGVPDVNVIYVGGTSQTARDLGASVLISAGTGAGQLSVSAGVISANAIQWLGSNITAANLVGVPVVDLGFTRGSRVSAAAGYVSVDWGTTTSQIAAVNLSGTTINAVNTVSGNISGTVAGVIGTVTGSMTGNVLGTVNSVSNITVSNGIVSADIWRVNRVTVNGDGSGTPWGP